MTTDLSQIESSIVDVKKHDGRITAFNKEKITSVIYKALVANGQADHKIADDENPLFKQFPTYEKHNTIQNLDFVCGSQNAPYTNPDKIGSMGVLDPKIPVTSFEDYLI